MLVKFRIRQNLRFLSHAEMVNVFQRACVRAGIDVQYSRGFNPRPRLSLPLPKTLGIESEDELLCLRVNRDPNEPQVTDYELRIKARLCEQLPAGCELLSVSIVEANRSFRPCSAAYVFTVKPEYQNENLRARIESLLASESLVLTRTPAPGSRGSKARAKSLDVRRFLKSIEVEDGRIVIECKISLAGTIRVDEMMELLRLDTQKLAAPIKRIGVQWKEE